MWSDLRDAWNWIQRLVWRVERLESGAFLENSSITNGRFRIIGGLLRVDSGGRVEVIGEWRFFGPGAITGDVVAEGKWTQNGPWEFNGPGDIDGNVDITGNLALLGSGKFTSENVRIEGGKVYVGAGGNLIIIDGATGRITAGSLTIDPASNGGSVKFAGGPEVYASGGTLSLYSSTTGAFIELGSTVKINGPGARWIEIDGTGIGFVGLPTARQSDWPGSFVGAIVADGASGRLYRIVPG